MFKDYYQILGIPQQASLNEIKEAYRVASKKWHPDANPGMDTTSMMQDINEAYAILKDEGKRKRYDDEYRKFEQQKRTYYEKSSDITKTETSWSYDYEIKDENLKEDINSARQYAKKIVADFLASLKETSHNAAKGAWEGARVFILIIIASFSIGFIINKSKTTKEEAFSDRGSSIKKNSNRVAILDSITEATTWIKYEIDGGFYISVPETVELRHEYDKYTKLLNRWNANVNKDCVIFQQKGLSKGANDNHYARIMILILSLIRPVTLRF